MARSKRDPGQGSYPGSVQQPPGAAQAHPGGSWVPNPVIPPSGAQAYKQHGVPDGAYSTGDGAIGSEAPPLGGTEMASAPKGAPSDVGTATYRGQRPFGDESAGSRLTFSPSMKLVDPTGYSVPTQANGRIVPNGSPGRSRGEFDQGVTSANSGATYGPAGPGGPPAVREQHPVGDAARYT